MTWWRRENANSVNSIFLGDAAAITYLSAWLRKSPAEHRQIRRMRSFAEHAQRIIADSTSPSTYHYAAACTLEWCIMTYLHLMRDADHANQRALAHKNLELAHDYLYAYAARLPKKAHQSAAETLHGIGRAVGLIGTVCRVFGSAFAAGEEWELRAQLADGVARFVGGADRAADRDQHAWPEAVRCACLRDEGWLCAITNPSRQIASRVYVCLRELVGATTARGCEFDELARAVSYDVTRPLAARACASARVTPPPPPPPPRPVWGEAR